MTPERAYEIANAILDENPELVEQWANRKRIQPSATSLRNVA
jgi:hypothetical protein